MKENQLIQKMTNVLDIQNQPTQGKALIEVLENSSVLIENHCGIISYTDCYICVRTKKITICVSGSCLRLKKITREQLLIFGCIQKIELNGR